MVLLYIIQKLRTRENLFTPKSKQNQHANNIHVTIDGFII
ncbi:hypothetical protein B4123_4037 [Bacillus paralicheniformis]|nr:hypothetical protein B4123_4037 [Bacillus paralicheniformis]TWN85373.1 hypothetical protein CHCC20492_0632 [Bacillus paralicheniformis]